MLIDCHQHTNWGGHDCDAVVADMDRAGIDLAWLLTWEVPEAEFDPYYLSTFDPRHSGLPFSDVVEACRRHPKRFVPGYAPDPRRPDAIERLESAVKTFGVRVYGELKVRIVVDDPDALCVFRRCGELGLPVLLHIDVPAKERPKLPARDYWYCVDLDRLERVMELCPETVFIGHAPGFWRHVSADGYTAEGAYPAGPVSPGGRLPELLAKCPRLYADVSANSGLKALERHGPAGARQFLVDHQDKVLFGRDGFDNRLADYLRTLDLPGEVWDKVTHRNALRLVPPGRSGAPT